MRITLSILSCLLLVACRYDTTDIQRQYSSDRDHCQDFSENKIQAYEKFSADQGKPMDVKSKNEKLVTFFNECMSGRNWEIGAAPKPADATPIPDVRSKGGAVPVYALGKEGSNVSDTTVPSYAYGAEEGYEQPPIANDLVVPSNVPLPPGGEPAVNGRVPEVTPTMQIPRAMPRASTATPEKLPATPTTPVPPAKPITSSAPAKAAVPVSKPKPTVTYGQPAETVEPSQLGAAPTKPVTAAPLSPPQGATSAAPPAPAATPAPAKVPASAATGKLSSEQEERLRKVLSNQ